MIVIDMRSMMSSKKFRDDRIIKYIKDNEKNSIILNLAHKGLTEYNLNLEDVLYHIIIYQDQQINNLKKILGPLNG